MKVLFLAVFFVGTSCAFAEKESPAPAVPAELSLAQALQLAVDHNPDLLLASTRFLDAEGKVLKLHAILYPTLDAQALTTPLTFYVQFQQTLYSHATFPQLRLSRLTREEALINYRQTLSDVVFQVRQAFIAAQGAAAQEVLLRQANDLQQKAVGSAKQFFDAGKIEKSALSSIEVTASLAQQGIATAQLSELQARLALSNLLGVRLPAATRLTGALLDAAPAALDTDALTAQALRDRPDLKLLQSLQLSGEQQIEIDMKDAYPVIGISSDAAIQPPVFPGGSGFDLERNYDDPATQRVAGQTQLPFSLYANWSIFDGGSRAGRKESAQAELASQTVAIDELRRSISREVAGAVAAITHARNELELLGGGTPPEQMRKSADLDFEAGYIRQLDRVNLETAIAQQEQAHLAAQIQLNLALAALDHALGRGLDSSPGLSSR
jgi:outer membrane protein TolC